MTCGLFTALVALDVLVLAVALVTVLVTALALLTTVADRAPLCALTTVDALAAVWDLAALWGFPRARPAACAFCDAFPPAVSASAAARPGCRAAAFSTWKPPK